MQKDHINKAYESSYNCLFKSGSLFCLSWLVRRRTKTGNEFEVKLAVSYDPGSELIDELVETVNYASLFSILQEEMQKPRELLETFVMEVADLLHKKYPSVKKIDISLSKLNPPIAKFWEVG
ncbi:MAG: dihydroneopterin aldolase [Chitinophagaceae bacterium]|nr:dihydroneopterin aldolase [Chitinophagaceae bacterium]